MSTKRTIPPIQPAPFRPFTLRLVDGHFVRVPKLDNLPATDATRPPAQALPESSDATAGENAPTRVPPAPTPDPGSWNYSFGSRAEPSDLPPKP